MIYPEIDSLRRVSETFDKMPDFGNKQKNCNRLFMKGPALTKDLFDKFGPESTKVFGIEVKARQLWFLAGLLLLFCSSFIGSTIMWFTSMFDNAIYSNLVIANNTEAYDLWKKPIASALVNIYIFNYTNIEDYETRSTDKLNVQEVGPYVYEEFLERVNIQFHENNTVSYQEKRSYKFRPELSEGHRQSDQLMVPNVPLLTGAAINRHAPYFQRIAFDYFMLKGLSQKPFISLPAQRFIFGYEDNFYSISKSILKMQDEKPTEEFGLLAHKVGVSTDVITINTGALDINKVGMIEAVNGEPHLNHWSTEECNSFRGTDGFTYPPRYIKEKKQIHYFSKQMCRAIPMNFDSEVSILEDKIPAYRYKMPESVFDAPEIEPHNQCYCDLSSGECAPQGAFNTTPCALGAPLFMSMPHFYKADPSVTEFITGLTPDSAKHESYVDFHPTMGFAMSGASRFQGNIQMIKTFGIDELSMFQQDNLMLPLTWMELSLEDKRLPDDMISIIYRTTFTIKGVELGLKYGCLLTAIVTFICIVIIIRGRCQPSQSPIPRHHQRC